MGVKDPNYWSWSEMTKRGHAMEHHMEWEYRNTWVFERDHPNGWADQDTPPGDDWEKNDQMGAAATPGFAVTDGASGRMFVSYWRRRKP